MVIVTGRGTEIEIEIEIGTGIGRETAIVVATEIGLLDGGMIARGSAITMAIVTMTLAASGDTDHVTVLV